MGHPAGEETAPAALAETVRDPFLRALYRHMPLLLRAKSMTNTPGTGTHGTRTRPLKLIRVAQNRPQWLNWPGFWGASIEGQFRSPRGPRQHDSWSASDDVDLSIDVDAYSESDYSSEIVSAGGSVTYTIT